MTGKENIKLDTTGWAKCSTGNWARSLNLTILITVLENETHKLLCNFEIQMDHLIRNLGQMARPSDSQQQKKRNC